MKEIIDKLEADILALKYSLTDAHKKFYQAKLESVEKDKIILDFIQKLKLPEVPIPYPPTPE